MKEMTLADRMREARLPVAEALRLAITLADTLRRLHDSGAVHGALTPDCVVMRETRLELLPAPGPAATTPYIAPEVAQGREPDIRSDIFSFGSIVFEMLTGQRAFTEDVCSAPLPASGSPAVDRFLLPCLAKIPESRTPRMQKAIMELKLLAVAARRAEAATALRREKTDAGAIRAEMQEMEARVEARLLAGLRNHEGAVSDIQRAASDALAVFKDQLSTLHADLAATQDRLAALMAAKPEEQIEAAGARILLHVNRGFQGIGESMAAMERTVEELKRHSHQFEQSVSTDLADIDKSVKAQAAAIEAARLAMTQTDDLVERVVEALESLQAAVLDAGEGIGEKSKMAVN